MEDKKGFIPRGFLRYYILKNLKNEDLHGYSLMKKIEEETGFWKPTPGSVYPTLRSLEKDGMIRTIKTKGRKNLYRITEEGKKLVISFEKSLGDMEKRFSGMMADILHVDRKEVDEMVHEIKMHCISKKSKLYSKFQETHKLIEKINYKDSIRKAEEIIEKTNKSLKRLKD
jgi:DNA-binding PadR family transcriptional regulator